MPLILPEDLLSDEVLVREKIFTMRKNRAQTQDIRPLKMAIVNLMPNKEETEIQLLKVLTNTPLQIHIDLVHMDSYRSKHTEFAHLERFYKTYEEIKTEHYDGMIITGAPVEKLPYDDIRYWSELKKIFDFAKSNVYSTLFICWSAQAALHYYYGVESHRAKKKIFGIYDLKTPEESLLFRGFDDVYAVPQSRHTYVDPKSLSTIEDIDILAKSDKLGVALAATKDHRLIFQFGHFEYDKYTLDKEYQRDLSKGQSITPPNNYYLNDDPTAPIVMRWQSAANLFFTNWLNYYVYQQTPYVIGEIREKNVAKFGGSSLSSAKQFNRVRDIIKAREGRDIVVVSAPGKRSETDTKVTDDLYRIVEAKKAGRVDEAEEIASKVKHRFDDLALELNLGPGPLMTIDQTIDGIIKSENDDFIISRGEYLNAKLLAAYIGYRFVDSRHLLKFNESGEVDVKASCEAICNHIERGDKVVVPGFYGEGVEGRIKLLSRGGSDYTGSLIASALKATVYENWTDVDGVFNADPKVDKNAKTIKELDYDGLLAIVEAGAKVYQKEAIDPVRNSEIPVKILNTNHPEASGTTIKKCH